MGIKSPCVGLNNKKIFCVIGFSSNCFSTHLTWLSFALLLSSSNFLSNICSWCGKLVISGIFVLGAIIGVGNLCKTPFLSIKPFINFLSGVFKNALALYFFLARGLWYVDGIFINFEDGYTFP